MDGLAQEERGNVFSSCLFSVDWMMSTSISKSGLLAQSTDSCANLSGNPFTDTPRRNVVSAT